MLQEMIDIEQVLPYTKEQLDKMRHYLTLAEEEHYTVEITPLQRNKYAGDLYGLLASLDVPVPLWYLTLELNRLDSSIAFHDIARLKIPDNALIPRIVKSLRT